MKFAALIYTAAIFGTTMAGDQLEEARNRALAATEVFMSNYSILYSDQAFVALNDKYGEILSSLDDKNEAANKLVRTPYDEFLSSLSLVTGTQTDCYHIAIMNLDVDVHHTIENAMQYPVVYGRVINNLYRLSSEILSGEFEALMQKIYSAINDVNITVAGLDAVTVQFEIDASDIVLRGRRLLSAIETELEKLAHKFNDENETRVSRTLDKLRLIKENYDNCLLYGF